LRYETTDKNTWFNLKSFANKNRKNPTFAEKIMWNALRNKRIGYRFRRQHAIDKFIVDFVCLEKMLIIEIDGISHEGKEDYDEIRTGKLNALGFRVIRYSDEEVLGNGNMVIENIKGELEK
jgi:very-short-patch-repair endonuclease